MGWICIAIVLFTIFGNISAQGYSYPTPRQSFPEAIISGGKPDVTQRPFGTQPREYAEQGPNTILTGYPGAHKPAGIPQTSEGKKPFDRFPGYQETSTPTSGSHQQTFEKQRPSSSISGSSVGYSGVGSPREPSEGQTPSDRFPESTVRGGQGYNYPTPGKPFAGGFPTAVPPTASGDEQKIKAGYPGQQQPSGIFPGPIPRQPGKSEPQIPSGGVQKTIEGQSFSGYPGAARPAEPLSGGQGPIVQQFPSQYPTVGRPSSSRPLEFPKQDTNGYSGAGTPEGSQFPSSKPQIPSAGGYATPFGGQKAPGEQGPGRYPVPQKPSDSQFSFGTPQITSKPTGYPNPSTLSSGRETPEQQRLDGYQDSQRPIVSHFPASGLQKPSGSIGGYPGPGARLEGQQSPSGYPTSASSPAPQFPATGFQRPSGPVGSYPSSDVPSVSGQGFSQYPSRGRPTESQFSTEGSFAQKPTTSYIPSGQGTGGLPLSERPATFPLPGQFGAAGISPAPLGQEGLSGRPQILSTSPNKDEEKLPRPQLLFHHSQKPGGYPTTGKPEHGATSTVQGRPFGRPSGSQDISDSQSVGGSTGIQGGFSNQPSQGIRPSEGTDEGQFDEEDYSAIPGEPERDYPILSFVPETVFKCDEQKYPGFYADVETRCQVFHICANNKTYDFLCPNGTIFHQENLVCVWWNKFNCNTAPSLYDVNEHIYDFSITGIQQTGGILAPGQDYPRGQKPEGYPTEGSTPSVSGQYPSVGPQFPGITSQKPGGYPSEELQSPGTTPQISGPSRPQISSAAPQGPGGELLRPSGSPAVPQASSSGGTQTPSLTLQRPGASQETGYRPQIAEGYPSGKPEAPSFTSTPSTGTNFLSRPELQRSGLTSQTPGGYPSGRPHAPGFPSRPVVGSQGSSGFPSGVMQRPGSELQKPGEYFNGRSEAPSFPQVGSQIPSGYPSGTAQGPRGGSQRSEGYPSGKQQGSGFSSGAGLQKPEEYSNGRSQIPNFPQEPVIGSQIQSGYPSGTVQRPEGVSQRPGGYPSERPQGPSFPSGSVSQGSSGYPSRGTQKLAAHTQLLNGKSQTPSYPSGLGTGTQIPTEYPSGTAQGPQIPEGYPRERPQLPGSPSESGFQAPSGYPSGVTQKPGAGLQKPGEYSIGIPQAPSFSQGPGTGSQIPSGYPSGAVAQKPERYPSETPKEPSFPSGNGSQAEIQGPSAFPSRPGSPFAGSPKPHQPTRDYLPPANRK